MTIQRKLSFTFCLVLMAFAVNLCAVSAATNTTELSSGIASYTAGNYANAIAHLARAVASDPTNATAHYYLACAYQRSNAPADAIAEYKLAQMFDREGTIARYASTALASYTNTAAAGHTVSGAATNTVADPEAKKALEQISRQGQDGQSLIQQTSNANVNSTQISATNDVQRLTQQRDREVSRMTNAHWTDKNGNTYPTYTSSQIDATRNDYDQRISDIKQDMADTVKKQQSLGLQTTAALKDSVSGLQSLLQTGAAGPDAVRLRPKGTSLFVRNYAAASAGSSSSPPKPELMATQQQLILVPHKDDKKPVWQVVPAGQSAEQDKLFLFRKQKPIQLQVHGVMVPPANAAAAANVPSATNAAPR